MKPLFERFYEKVDKRGPIHPVHGQCWEWIAYRQKFGYGIMSRGERGKSELAHRVSYELEHGPFDKTSCVLHKCDNPPCVNPNHLFLGNKTENNADMIQKGRGISPLANKNAAKTHCPKGHEYGTDGFYLTKANSRMCKICYREHARNYRHANIEKIRERDKKRRPRMTSGDNVSGAPRKY